MQELLQLFRFDRQTKFYDSGPMIRRYARRDAARRVAARKAAAAAKAAKAAAAATKKANAAAAAKRKRESHFSWGVSGNPVKTIGRYKGGSTRRSYDGSYHVSSARTSRRSSRESRRQTLGRRKTGRYSQLM